MDVAELEREWEARETAINLESYRQYAGLGADEARMEALAAEVEALARRARETIPRETLPELLWLGLAGQEGAGERTRLQNELYRLRTEAVAVEAAGARVDLNSVRRFNHAHVRDHALRREVFDGLLEKARVLTPVLERRFSLSAETWGRHGLTPLDAYCMEEGLTPERLERVVDESARAARPAFRKEAEAFSEEILGRPMSYEDDMYVFRHSIFEPVDGAFVGVDFEARCAELARGLGFPVERVAIDGEARPGKFSSPVCFGIRIPGDVRILYQRTSPLGDHESFYHEMGHALHFISVEADRRFHERRLIPNGVAEIFSTLFEEVGMDPLYLEEDLGLAPDVVAEVLRRRRFLELFFLTFYGANSMHKVRFWREGLWRDLDAADRVYEELTERYMGVRVPGRYWQTHHILSMSDMYAPSYLLAHIRKSELLRVLQRRFGRAWWRDPGAGAFLREEAMGPGASVDLAAFSRLDAEAYLAPILAGGG